MKLSAHHFPVGTQFSLKADSRSYIHDLPEVMTAVGVVRNGVDSYCVQTDLVAFLNSDGTPHFHALNLAHIEAVVQRGTGPLKLDHGWYGHRGRQEYLKDVLRMELHGPDLGGKISKGYWLTASLHSVLHLVVSQIVPDGTMVDYEGLFIALETKGWVTSRKIHTHFHVWRVNKKRLKAYLRANWTRHQIKMKAALAAEEAMNCEMYERDMDDDWEAPAPQPKEYEGSCYTEEDGHALDDRARKEWDRTRDCADELGGSYRASEHAGDEGPDEVPGCRDCNGELIGEADDESFQLPG